MKTKKSISELIDEEVKRNPILSDEEIEEMFEPTSEDIPFDKKQLCEDIAYIDRMYYGVVNIDSRENIFKIIENKFKKRELLNESRRNSKNT